MKSMSCGLCALAVLAAAGSAHATVIEDWNLAYLQAIRQQPAGPPTMGRAGAMVHLAIYNAVNAVDQTYQPYNPDGSWAPPVVAGTNREAAIAVAANQVLKSLYSPALYGQFDSLMNSQLAAIPAGPGKDAGIALGQYSASHIIKLRAADGALVNPGYTPGVNPGDWQPTQPGNPADPHMGNCAPFGMTHPEQFRIDKLAPYGGSMANFLASPEYTTMYNDVKENGRIDKWTPADEQYKIAFFWANDRNGTYKPPGHLNEISQTMADRQHSGLSDAEKISREARMFALLNMAMADAGVAAWDMKYDTNFDFWRPITGVRNADTDGNPNTISDPAWEPLNNVDPDGPGPLSADPFTPPFPAYISGHATFGAAHAAIMRNFFGGTDAIEGGPLEIGSEDPYNPVGYTRTFSSWEAMARENGRSRIYLGVHWQMDADDGYITGTNVGNWIFDHFLQPVPTPGAGLTLLGAAGLFVARRRRN